MVQYAPVQKRQWFLSLETLAELDEIDAVCASAVQVGYVEVEFEFAA